MGTDWERHNTTFKEYKKECKAAHDKYLNDNGFNDEANPKKFYTYVKNKRKDYVSVSTLKVNGCFIIDDCQKANALNDQYCSVFSTSDEITPPINTPEVKIQREFKRFSLESNRKKHQVISHHVIFRNF